MSRKILKGPEIKPENKHNQLSGKLSGITKLSHRYCKIICPNTPHRKLNKALFGFRGPSEVFECFSRKKPPYNRQIVYLVYPQVYDLPLIGGYKSTTKTIARKRGSQKTSQKMDSLLHLHRKASNTEFCGFSEAFECPSGKKLPYNRQIVYLVYPQVYDLPLIGGYKSTTKTIVRKRGSQKTSQKMDSLLHLHQKASKEGLYGFSEVFECPSGKKLPYNRQIVYLVYPQVYDLPLIGGYKSTTKTIARKRVTQKALDRKKSNKELFGFCGCRFILESAASHVGIHICGSFAVFECLSGKKPPYNRQIVYLVYPQVYDLPLIGGYKSTAKTIARKRVNQKALDRKKSNKELFGFCGCRLILELAASYVGIHICGSFEAFECLSEKKPPYKRQIVYLVYLQVYVLPLIGGYKFTAKTIARKRGSRKTSQKMDSLLHLHQKASKKGFCGFSEVFECPSGKKPPYKRQIVYLGVYEVYDLPLIGGYKSTAKTIARKRDLQKTSQKMDSLLHLHQKASKKGLYGFSEVFECFSRKKPPYNRQIVYLVYPQVYDLPLIGGYKSTAKTIARKRGSQKTSQKIDSLLHLHQKASKEGLYGFSEAFECPSGKKPPYNRQIVYLVYPQVYVLPLIGGYKSTAKTIARKRVTQKALDRKKSNKELFGFCGCRFILESAASYVGIHVCGSFEVFECFSRKKPPYNRQIVYLVYPQVYDLPLIGGYKSTAKTIARKRGSQKTSQKMDSLLHLHRKASKKGFCGFSEAFECPSGKKPPYNRQIVYLVYPQVYDLPLIGGYKSTTKTIVRKKVTQKALDRKKSNKELFGFCGCRFILESAASYVGIHVCGSFEVFECFSRKKPPYKRQIVYLVYLQVYDLPLIGGYKSTAKTIARKRGSQKTSQKMDSLLHLHQKASKKGFCGFSEAFECPSGKKLPYNRQIVYPQVYDLPLIGGYKSTTKTIARKRDSQKASQKMDSLLHLHRKASKKGFCGFSEAFECPSGKKLPYNRQIVYPQVYDLPLIGGYKSTAKTIARKRDSQKASQKMDSLLHLHRKASKKGLYGFSEAFECPSGKKLSL